jgi:hypothetical protein
MCFERLTTGHTLYERLNEKFRWAYGSVYLPAADQRLACVLDDLNLAKVSVVC